MKREPLTAGTQRSSFRAKFFVLSDVCSVDIDDSSACPLMAIRKMSPEERIVRIIELTEEAALNSYRYCRLCFEAKRHLKERKPTNSDLMPLIEAKKRRSPFGLAKK